MTGAVKCTVMYAFFRLVIFIILLADVSILPTGYFELNLFAYCFDMAVASVLLATSTIEEVRPAIPWISDGMMILVALPSAAFVNASRLLSVIT